MRGLITAAVLALSGLALAACHDKPADTGKSAAAAEVLPGSASDAMIAYDTLKSQPPLAEPTASDRGERAAGVGKGVAPAPTTEDTAPASEAAPAPAGTQAPPAA